MKQIDFSHEINSTYSTYCMMNAIQYAYKLYLDRDIQTEEMIFEIILRNYEKVKEKKKHKYRLMSSANEYLY